MTDEIKNPEKKKSDFIDPSELKDVESVEAKEIKDGAGALPGETTATATFKVGEVIIMKDIYFKVAMMQPEVGVLVLQCMTPVEVKALLAATAVKQNGDGKEPEIK